MSIDYKIDKINNIQIKPIINDKELNDKNKIVGYDYFKNPFSNVFICSKKRSGKTNTIFHILKNSIYKDCKVIFFCSTIMVDATYKKIMKMLDTKKIDYEPYDSFKDENGDDLLEGLVNDLKNPELEEEDEEDKSDEEVRVLKNGIIDFGQTRLKKKKKPKKKKEEKIFSKLIVVIDDMGKQCRNGFLNQLLKTNRHSKTRVIISSQFLNDLEPSALKQLDYFLCFRSLNPEKLEKIHQDLDIGNIDFDDFHNLYKEITEEPFSFLYIDVRNEVFRKNFDIEINIIKKE